MVTLVGLDFFSILDNLHQRPPDFLMLFMTADHEINMAKSILNVTVKGDGKKHHGSFGLYLGFGFTNKYDTAENCTYGPVCVKDKSSLNEFQENIDMEFKNFVNSLEKVIPGVVDKGQYIAKELEKISGLLSTVDSQVIKCFGGGFVTGMMNIDAQTSERHTEKDCSLTLIGVPHGVDKTTLHGNYVFEFYWGDGKYIRIKLKEGTVLYYAAYLIMHRQMSLVDECKNKEKFNFLNFSTYTNQNFYQHCMTSFKKNQDNIFHIIEKN